MGISLVNDKPTNSSLSLADLIPIYPSQDDVNYQTIVSGKKEFNELASSPREELQPGQMFKHQKLLERFMVAMDRGFIFHRTGTGKTCTIIGASEFYRMISECIIATFRSQHHTETPIKHVYIIVKGDSLVEDFKQQYFCKCTNMKYLTHELETSKIGMQRTVRTNKEISKWYRITTYRKFADELSAKTDDQIRRDYSNSLFFADEIHMYTDPKGAVLSGETGLSKNKLDSIYGALFRLFHLIDRSKAFIATATPMINDVEPLKRLMNLILPMNRQIPESIKIATVSDKTLIPYLTGMISYVRELDTGVDIIDVGKPVDLGDDEEIYKEIGFRPTMKIQSELMSKLQTNSYIKAVKGAEDEEGVVTISENSFHHEEKNISNFVFPDGSYGGKFPREITSLEDKRGNKKEIKTDGISKYVKSPKDGQYNPTEEFKRYLSDINNVKRSSAKTYATLTSAIKNPKHKYFVYERDVHGSGVIVKSLCFDYVRTPEVPNGFSSFTGDTSAFTSSTQTGTKPICTSEDLTQRKIKIQPKRRYALLTGKTSPTHRTNILELFNSPENRYGEYIQVLIGSMATREGMNLADVTEIFISPEWHETGMYQAMSRAIRATSHVNLIKDKAKELGIPEKDVRIDVNLHRLAAIPNTDQVDIPNDVAMYLLAEDKDRRIKPKERLLMKAANDCRIHYKRNVRSTDKPNSPQCAYGDCDYECVSAPPEDTDFSTFDILFLDDLINRLSNTLMSIFQVSPILTQHDLHKKYPDIEPHYINRAVERMVYTKHPLLNNYGYTVFLENQGNIVFVQFDYPTPSIHYPISEYSTMMSAYDHRRLEDFIRTYQQNVISNFVTLGGMNIDSPEFLHVVENLDIVTLSNIVEDLINEYYVIGRKTKAAEYFFKTYGPFLYTIHEPVKDIIRSTDQLQVRIKGKGRKPVLSRLKPYKFDLYPEEKSKEKIYFHILREIKDTQTKYGKASVVIKASEKIRILKPSEKTGWRFANEYELPVYNAIKNKLYNEAMDKIIGTHSLYGTVTDDGVFRVVDKSKEDSKKDKRTESTGRDCSTSSFYLEDMYKLLIQLKLKPPPEAMKKIPKATPSQIEAIVRKKLKDTTTKYTTVELKEYYDWIKSGWKREKICPIIEKYFRDHNLLVTPDAMSFLKK